MMKLNNWNAATGEWDSTTVAQGQVNFECVDRLGRVMGAGFYIQAQNYVEETGNGCYRTAERSPALAGGPGLYFEATVFNTRNGNRWQSTTSILCASQEAAQRYCTAYLAKKAKLAAKASS